MNGTAQLFRTTEKRPPSQAPPIPKKLDRPRLVQSPALSEDALVVCQDNLVFMRTLPDVSMKLIIASPPYNMGKKYEERSSLGDYLEAQRASIKEAVRLLHPNGSICWQIGNYVDEGEVFPLDILLYPIFKKAGPAAAQPNHLDFRPRIALSETAVRAIRNNPLVYQKRRLHIQPGQSPCSVEVPEQKTLQGTKKGKAFGQPARKESRRMSGRFQTLRLITSRRLTTPVISRWVLSSGLVLALTDKGDAVLDPYLGVGSSAIAALKNGRKAYGCDILPEYVDIAKKRIAELRAGKLRVRPMNKPVYEPPPRECE